MKAANEEGHKRAVRAMIVENATKRAQEEIIAEDRLRTSIERAELIERNIIAQRKAKRVFAAAAVVGVVGFVLAGATVRACAGYAAARELRSRTSSPL